MSIWIYFSAPIARYLEAQSAGFSARHTGSAGGLPSKAQSHDFRFSHRQDATSMQLYQACAQGTIFDTVDIEYYKGPNDDLYLSYKLTEVAIGSVATGGGGEPIETIGLNFAGMTSHYFKT